MTLGVQPLAMVDKFGLLSYPLDNPS